MTVPIYHLIPNAPKPVAPYSHVVEADGWLFVTGQLATDPDDDSLPLPEGIETQTRKVMDNLKRALAGVGAGFEHVVCVRIFLTDFERDYAARADDGRRHAFGARRHRRGGFDRPPFLSRPGNGRRRSGRVLAQPAPGVAALLPRHRHSSATYSTKSRRLPSTFPVIRFTPRGADDTSARLPQRSSVPYNAIR